jgi:hypothetical protein
VSGEYSRIAVREYRYDRIAKERTTVKVTVEQ